MKLRTWQWAILLGLVLLALSPVSFAWQATPTAPAPTTPVGVAGTIVVLAGMVSAVLQGLKQIVPQINGKVALVVSVVASIAAAYAVAPAGSVLTIQFLTTTVGTAFASNGIYNLFKVGSSNPSAPAITSSK